RIAHVGTATALRDFDTADVGSASKAEELTLSTPCPLCLQQRTACWAGDSVPRADHAGRVDLHLERWAGLGRANSLHLDQGRAGKAAGEELPARAPYLGVFVEVGYVHRDGHDVVHLATCGLQQVLELLEDRLGLGVHVVAGVLPLRPRAGHPRDVEMTVNYFHVGPSLRRRVGHLG